MKVTTVRFGGDLWALLEHEAAMDGVSVSQYIREAALARAVAAGSARGEAPFEMLAGAVREVAPEDRSRAFEHTLAALARATAAETRSEAAAVRRQSAQAQRRARGARGEARDDRLERHEAS